MRGGLDDALARMARREELLRRAAEPADEAESTREADRSGRSEPSGGERPAGPDPVEDVTAAVRRVVARHPGLTVTLRAEHDGAAYALRVGWVEETVTVTPAPVWPLPDRTVPSGTGEGRAEDPAARLAELIRRDPSLLDGDGVG